MSTWDEKTPDEILSDINYILAGTQQSFKDAILRVDSLAEIDFVRIQYGVWIRPSHPRYRDAILRAAFNNYTMGVQIVVVKEVDETADFSTFYQELMGDWFNGPCAAVPVGWRQRLWCKVWRLWPL